MKEKEIHVPTNKLCLQRESGDVDTAHTQETPSKSYRRVNLEERDYIWVFTALFRTAYNSCCLKLGYI